MVELRERYAALEDKTWMTSVLLQARDAGTLLNLQHGPTVRKYEIGRVLVAMSEAGADDEVFRAVLALVMGEEVQPAVTTGAAVAALTIEEARTARAVIEGLGISHAVLIDDSGTRVVAA